MKMWWDDIFLLVDETAICGVLLDFVDVGYELLNLGLCLFFPRIFLLWQKVRPWRSGGLEDIHQRSFYEMHMHLEKGEFSRRL
jgi:hypothetical protein